MSFSLYVGIFATLIQKKRNNNTLLIGVIFIFLFLYSALRSYLVGIDSYNYTLIFKDIISTPIMLYLQNSRIENGYVILNYILGIFTKNPQIIFVFSSLIINYSFARSFLKYSENTLLSTMIYIAIFFSSTMNITRQYLALSLIFLYFESILDKKVGKSIVFLILATLFHNTAIIFAPLLIFAMSNINFTQKNILLLLISLISVSAFHQLLIENFVKLFPIYGRFLSSRFYSSSSQLSLPWLLIYLLILILSLIAFKYLQNINKKNSSTGTITQKKQRFGLIIIWYMMFILSFYLSSKLWIASRLFAYFQPSLCFIIPNTIEYVFSNNKKIKKSMYVFVFILFFLWAIHIFKQDPHGVFPYDLFWQIS